ncbi:MAG: D-lactate dehydrogenase [Terricaulis sp.]
MAAHSLVQPHAPVDAAPDTAALLGELRRIIGAKHVRVGADAKRYASGYRCGVGECLAAVQPANLSEMWRVLAACVRGGVIVIAQAANTGLTGGSTPWGDYDRPVIVLSTLRVRGVRLLQGGAQAVCLAGATLDQLERALRPAGREVHSVIGSSCLGASVVGGVCNNSGGALVRRGPAYTEMALYARVDSSGELELINHLGLDLGDAPEAIMATLDNANEDLDTRRLSTKLHASSPDYERHLRDLEAATPARYNADPRHLCEASGSAGKVIVFAVRLDTFAPEAATRTFYVGANDPDCLGALRRHMLASPLPLPISAEYLHRGAFDMAARFGKDTFLAIRLLGVERLAWLARLKNGFDHWLGAGSSDRVLQRLATSLPPHLPKRMRRMRDAYEHHLLLKVSASDADRVASVLDEVLEGRAAAAFECSAEEAAAAFLHRFVTAGAAVRYRALHGDEIADIMALDLALPRNARDWAETLAPELSQMLAGTLYYGHFFCHVFHHDYLVRKGADVAAFECAIHARLDAIGAEYPAEHNVGHLYHAKPALARHYRDLDPLNGFNPGVGKLSKQRSWA